MLAATSLSEVNEVLLFIVLVLFAVACAIYVFRR